MAIFGKSERSQPELWIMKATYFIVFIAKSICILLFLFGSASALTDQKEDRFFCFEVYDYVYLDNGNSSAENFELNRKSFYFLLEQVNVLKKKPLFVKFKEDQVVYYFPEPCSVSMKDFPDFIANHNQEFNNKLMLAPSQNYKTQDIECVFSEKLKTLCPSGHVSLNKGARTLRDIDGR